jgi:hypothetical protein
LVAVFTAVLGLFILCCEADAETARKLLKLSLAEDGRSAEVKVPAGYRSVTLQKFSKEQGWKKVATRQCDQSGVLRFKLPKAGKDARWRAIGRFEAADAPRGKFPAAFYQGGSGFSPVKSDLTIGGSRIFAELTGVTPDVVGEVPDEADIWKIDGRTVYYFNQLRGLQVLDLSDPADPRLLGTLRLPAVGDDLYLLPGTGKVRHLVLLTERYDNDEGAMTRIHMVRVEGGDVRITARRDVPGSLADSRLQGNRLILATNEWTENINSADGTVTDYGSVSHLTQWLLTPGSEPLEEGGFEIEGMDPIIAAGSDWLAVSVNPNDDWEHSEISVFGMDDSGLTKLTPAPIRAAGSISDQFKIRWKDNVLTTISEKNLVDDGTWTPVTLLENFRVWGAGVIHPAVVEGRLGKLALAEGESLYATRFADDKAYIVTFEQTDPLWVVDLSDARNPVIAGSLEVPGWSSHIETIGDRLFTIGWDADTVVASLFDVADPSKPALLDRLELGPPGTYSEAAWDEKALKLLRDEGLAMVPVATYGFGESVSLVQLLDVDVNAGSLTLRGAIEHEFDARRADLIGNAVVSISQRVLVSADVSDRDHPSVLAEVSLAWPVDRVVDAGSHLIQIEDGAYWGYGRATARLSPADDCEAVVAEIDLGEGVVRGADLKDGKLYVLRERGSRGGLILLKNVAGDGASARVTLDVYDAGSLPSLTKLGSCSRQFNESLRLSSTGLLWPQPNRPVAIFDGGSSFWFGFDFVRTPGPVTTFAEAAVLPKRVGILPVIDRFPFWRPARAPRLLAFDVSDAASPSAGELVAVGNARTIPNGFYQAADGLVVLGADDWKDEADGEWYPAGSAMPSVYVAEVPLSGEPTVRPVIDLPGGLFAVSELDRDGFLAFSRKEGEAPGIVVSACDGYDAFEVTGIDSDPSLAATAGERRLFVATKGGVERHRLSDRGVLVKEANLEVGWTPDSLRWTNGILLGSKWNKLFAAEPGADQAESWRFSGWSLRFENVTVAADGDLLVPFGEYGAERLDR